MTIPHGKVSELTNQIPDRIETDSIDTQSEMTINDNATSPISNRRTLRSKLSKPLILIAGVALVAGCTSNNSTEQVSGTSGAAGTAGAAATKFCMHCGKAIPRTAKFCPECGGTQE